MLNARSLVIIILPLFAIACGEGDLIKSFEFDEAITAIDVANEYGNLCITPTEDDTTTVEFDLTWEGREPSWDVEVVGSTLYVYLDCDRVCNGDIYIKAPFDAVLNTESPNGHVFISDMENTVTARVNNGNLTVERLSGTLTLETGFGNIRGTELTSEGAFVQAYTGWINVDFEDEVQGIIARTHAGDIKMTVPSGFYDIYTEYVTGEVNTDGIIYEPGATKTITAITTIGNIDILGI